MFRLRSRLTSPAVLLSAATAWLALPNGNRSAQAAGTDGLRSATRGLALVDSAIAANGALDRLRAVEDLTVRYRGRRWMAYQSEKASPPWTTQPTLTDLVID